MASALRGRNLLLDSISPAALRGLKVGEQQHGIKTVLIRPDETPSSLFFPSHGALVSVVRSTKEGAMVESGVIGGEGLFSVQTAITIPAPTGSEALVQTEGAFFTVEVELFKALFRKNAAFRDRVLAFTSSLLTQVTQNLVCIRLHHIEERLAKWLVVVQERVSSDDLHLTQDFLSHMLGIHRPGVSIAVAALERDGLIAHARARITIRDRKSLEARSCECFKAIHSDLVKLRKNLIA